MSLAARTGPLWAPLRAVCVVRVWADGVVVVVHVVAVTAHVDVTVHVAVVDHDVRAADVVARRTRRTNPPHH